MDTIFWLLAFAGTALTVAYRRVGLKNETVTFGVFLAAYSLFGADGAGFKFLLWICLGLFALLNLEDFRRENLTRRMLKVYRSMLPPMSDTEREALESGTVWWEGELFSGMPNWTKLMSMPAPKLSDEEQAFLDGPTEELCRMLDDWDTTHERARFGP